MRERETERQTERGRKREVSGHARWNTMRQPKGRPLPLQALKVQEVNPLV